MSLPLELPIPIKRTTAGPLDFLYGPYVSVDEACTKIPRELRSDGLTVLITGIGEYWWQVANLDNNGLLPKISSVQQGKSTPLAVFLDADESKKTISFILNKPAVVELSRYRILIKKKTIPITQPTGDSYDDLYSDVYPGGAVASTSDIYTEKYREKY